MAAREPSRHLARAVPRVLAPSSRPHAFLGRRNASDNAPERSLSKELNELETDSSLAARVDEKTAKAFDPAARAKARKTQLPRGRYVNTHQSSV